MDVPRPLEILAAKCDKQEFTEVVKESWSKTALCAFLEQTYNKDHCFTSRSILSSAGRLYDQFKTKPRKRPLHGANDDAAAAAKRGKKSKAGAAK